MNNRFDSAKDLAAALLEQRLPNIENELVLVFRDLEPPDKQKIIEILLEKNVRAAAAIANRGDLPKAQQQVLIERLIIGSQTNAIKAFVSGFIVHRMSADMFIRILDGLKAAYPKGVNFAAYYFLGGVSDSEARSSLKSILEETKPVE